MIKSVIKRDGRVVLFDEGKIASAVLKALEAAGATPDMSAEELCAAMIEQFTTMTFDGLTGDGMTWDANGQVSKSPKGMVIQDGAYVGLD